MSEVSTQHKEGGVRAALGREVPIGRIESELRELWRSDQASTKASLINLAVYGEQPDALEANSAIMGEVTRDHACRALLVGARIDTGEPGCARAWITAHCNLIAGRKSVCSEQIAFELVGKATGRIRNIVFAHLVPDLPLVFWWQGPLSRVFEPRLYKHIDRLIVDSAQWSGAELAGNIERLAGAAKEAAPGLVPHDLSWTRCQQMRLAFAMLFDSRKAQAALQTPRRLLVEGRPANLPTMLLLVAWIARSTGWRLVSGCGDGARYETNEGVGLDVHISAVPGVPACPPVSRLALECGDGTFETNLDSSCRYIRAVGSCDGVETTHLVPADPVNPAALVSSLLARAGGNQLFRELLQDFHALARAMRSPA